MGLLTPTPSSNNDKRSRPHQLPTLKSRLVDQEEDPPSLSPPTSPSSSSTSSISRIRTLVTPAAAGGRKIKFTTTTSSSVCKGKVPDAASSINTAIVECIKTALYTVYGHRHYARFHALETVARVPYFSYTSVLHLYESLGWRRRADLMKIHFVESWNELHHLLIMEELGGNKEWIDRLLSVHLAFSNYWYAVFLYMASPETAYNLNEQVEKDAFETYDNYLNTYEKELKAMPPAKVAKEYYQTGDLYVFDEFRSNVHPSTKTPHPPSSFPPSPSSSDDKRPRPKVETLYDVFVNIRNDEQEHFKNMSAMQQDGGRKGGDACVVTPKLLVPSEEKGGKEEGEEDCGIEVEGLRTDK